MISIYETIKKLDPLFFKYGSIASSMWRDITVQAKKDFKVWFDQENDDVYKKQERTITILSYDWNVISWKYIKE